MMKRALLDGVQVIDLTMGWAGPLATRHLADMGAEVIKVEACQRPDWWRGWEKTPEWVAGQMAEKAPSFNTMNRNKLGVTLDLTADEGKELLKRLVATAGILVENFSVSVLEKLGLDYPVLSDLRPDLIMMSMPAFGTTGPWRNYRAYGSTAEHASGLPHLHGRREDPPVMLHVAYGDAVAGLNAAAAILSGIRNRHRTGEGQHIDLSQSECLLPLAAHGVIEQSVSGQAPERLGNASPDAAPHGVYPCAGDDRWITIQIFTEQQWGRLKELASPCLDEFGDLKDRQRRIGDLDRCLAEWTVTADGDELMFRLQAEGVPAAVVRSPDELVRDPHLEARGFWCYVDRVVVGVQPHPVPPYRSNGGPFPIARPSPTLGEDNEKVLKEMLGLDDTEFDALGARNIIGTHPILGGA